MLISDSHRFVFVHIRKAAGTSLRQILAPHALPKKRHWWYKLLSRNGWPVHYHNYAFRKHAVLAEAEASMPADLFQTYFKFAIVRNPWERLVSEFEYIKTKPKHSRHKKLSNMTFAEYIEYQSRRPAAHQVKALQLKNGQLGCDFVGKLETLPQSLSVVAAKTGLDFSALPHVNQVQRRDYRSYYQDDMAARVGELWQADVEAFQYTFE
ncbi:sulfotransferase family 2 domain-containing protein [Marinicella meishanensis]|uniref:sulfotransferase family 2 domain-containing protein n=1 Tax=Marinicella meishanensis TaxID=2873263 RepID=UPI001CBF90FC|nr:sulfotransferase family 2 domain-containing protein [Marinicella sp. NBU2979]